MHIFITMPIKTEMPRPFRRTKGMKSQKQAACIIGHNTLQACKPKGRAMYLRSGAQWIYVVYTAV